MTTVTAASTTTAATAASSTTGTLSSSTNATAGIMFPTDTIVVPNVYAQPLLAAVGVAPPLPPPDPNQRAIHRVRLSALQHNFSCVESAANRQRCAVIVVVKADGYGHGAIATALHLADTCGADSFAVATLEEAIALRRAFENNPPGRWNKKLASHFVHYPQSQQPQQHQMPDVNSHQHQHQPHTATSTLSTRSDSPTLEAAARVMRPARIRILVLGPPVGYPRCFDDYHHHAIEVMVSGPEVAASLLEWLANDGERKRTQVERAAMVAKEKALMEPMAPRDAIHTNYNNNGNHREEKKQEKDATNLGDSPTLTQRKTLPHPSSTLGNVQGQDLAKELRAILMYQNKAAADAAHSMPPSKRGSALVSSEAVSSDSSVSSDPKQQQLLRNNKAGVLAKPKVGNTSTTTVGQAPQVFDALFKPQVGSTGTTAGHMPQVFGGIEAVAKDSRGRELAVARANEVFTEDAGDSPDGPGLKVATAANPVANGGTRKRLRWHALVDSGMGRLGFRTDPLTKDDPSGLRDTVEIIKELLDMEIHGHAPLEFYGMCTHMADASSTSKYTNSQISKFTGLLKRVRAAGISVPTVSTDNSAALLTNELTHFDPDEMLTQPDAHTRGYVRTGGAIYGQRPAFKQLKAVSTLLASVRHVAILKEGESVGYDRAYIAPRDVRIATLMIGFADGYPRELGNGVGKVVIRGALFPLAGNVCMDMLMVELGPAEDKEGVGATVVVGDVAVLWGPLDEDGDDDEGLVKLADIASTLKTTQSALTCGLDNIRVLRQFV